MYVYIYFFFFMFIWFLGAQKKGLEMILPRKPSKKSAFEESFLISAEVSLALLWQGTDHLFAALFRYCPSRPMSFPKTLSCVGRSKYSGWLRNTHIRGLECSGRVRGVDRHVDKQELPPNIWLTTPASNFLLAPRICHCQFKHKLGTCFAQPESHGLQQLSN